MTVAIFGRETDAGALAARFGDAVRIWQVDGEDPDGVLAAALGLTAGAAVIRPDIDLGAVVAGVAPAGAIGAWLADTLHLHEAGAEARAAA